MAGLPPNSVKVLGDTTIPKLSSQNYPKTTPSDANYGKRPSPQGAFSLRVRIAQVFLAPAGGGVMSISLPANSGGEVGCPVGEPPCGSSVMA